MISYITPIDWKYLSTRLLNELIFLALVTSGDCLFQWVTTRSEIKNFCWCRCCSALVESAQHSFLSCYLEAWRTWSDGKIWKHVSYLHVFFSSVRNTHWEVSSFFLVRFGDLGIALLRDILLFWEIPCFCSWRIRITPCMGGWVSLTGSYNYMGVVLYIF